MPTRLDHAMPAEMRDLIETWNNEVPTPVLMRTRIPWWRRKITSLCQSWKKKKTKRNHQSDFNMTSTLN